MLFIIYGLLLAALAFLGVIAVKTAVFLFIVPFILLGVILVVGLLASIIAAFSR